MLFFSESKSVDSAILSSLNISTDTTFRNKANLNAMMICLQMVHYSLIDSNGIKLNMMNVNLTITVQLQINMMKNVIVSNL